MENRGQHGTIEIRVSAAPPAKDGGSSIRAPEHVHHHLVLALREAMDEVMRDRDPFEGEALCMDLRLRRARCKADGLNLINGIADVLQYRCPRPEYRHDVWVYDDDANIREFHFHEERGDQDSYEVRIYPVAQEPRRQAVSFVVDGEAFKEAARHLYERLEKEADFHFFSDSWPAEVPDAPGVYLIWNRASELVYVGETANLRERMKDICRTCNHTCRRKVGRVEFGATIEPATRRFDAEAEARVTAYFKDELKVAFAEVNMGRKELEHYLLAEHHPDPKLWPKYNGALQRGRRTPGQ